MADPASAQSRVGLRGRVVVDSTERPVVGAEILVGSGPVVTRTDSTGAFALRSLAPGPIHVIVRAIGYRPLAVDLELPSLGILEVTLQLQAGPQTLDPIEVAGRSATAAGKLVDFERRRTFGNGSFLTRAQLAEQEPLPLSVILRRLHGVSLLRRPWRCGGGFAVATGRAHYIPPTRCAEAFDGYARGCYLSVYVDGVRRYETGDPDPPNIDDFLASRVEAIELYRGPAELPGEYSGTGVVCGAVLIWTRISGVP